MDKNTFIGFLLIIAILVGYSWLSQPSAEEQARMRAQQDSLRRERVQAEAIEEALRRTKQPQVSDSTATSQSDLDGFISQTEDSRRIYLLENDLIKVQVSAKGGYVSQVEVKDYKTGFGAPMLLFGPGDVSQNMTLVTKNNRILETKNLCFTGKMLNDSTLEMSLSTVNAGAFKLIYTLPAHSYRLQFDIQANRLDGVISPRETGLEMEWGMRLRQQEKGRKFENRYAGLYYKFIGDDVENLNTEKSDSEKATNRIKWVAFKDQFFSSILIAENYFSGAEMQAKLEDERSFYLKDCDVKTLIPFDPTGKERTHLSYFFGPNKYRLLRDYDDNIADSDQSLQLHRLLPLGWGIFGWVNMYLIIPIFDWLGNYFVNYGLIIFLLTLIIKLILLPFTFKSYMSTAKMRVLRPQMEEINARIPAEKTLERQQATMDMYRKAGVSPMGGCLPMLLQMPILFAMFTFFPACIELRQQGFLWADDLSTFDSIFSWDTYIPILSSIYGNHISLFCLLMSLTNIAYTAISMRDQAGSQQMPMMKWMMYFMPIMFLFIFNDYAAGLSYYYLVSMLITIAQTFLFRLFVNDEKVLAQLKANSKKNVGKKKSGWMARLEEMQKQQLEAQRKQAKEQQAKMLRSGKRK